MIRSGTAQAVSRSLSIYYRDRARWDAMQALLAQFVPAGGLAFDIGAHVGDRTASFMRLGARVVAVEPQSGVFRALRLIHGRAPGVTLLQLAVGAQEGRATLLLNTANPMVTTTSPAFVAAAEGAPLWHGQVWDRQMSVTMTTLDALIAAHGMPDFVKIDVEGGEDAVLAGLSMALPALSFEFTTHCRDVALRCLARLERLAPYRFNVSLGETHRLELTEWIDALAMADHIAALPQSANSGDVYAVLKDGGA